MRRDHIRPILIALAIALMAINASLALGLRNGGDSPLDLHETVHETDHEIRGTE